MEITWTVSAPWMPFGVGLQDEGELVWRDRWDIGNKSFPGKVGRGWDGIPKKSMAVPSLGVPKAGLGRAWSTQD